MYRQNRDNSIAMPRIVVTHPMAILSSESFHLASMIVTNRVEVKNISSLICVNADHVTEAQLRFWLPETCSTAGMSQRLLHLTHGLAGEVDTRKKLA